MIIQSVFPEPVYFSKLARALTKEELQTINKYKKKTYKNTGNLTSLEHFVLEDKALKNLKEDLQKIVVDYFNKVVCTKNSIIPYITQSWLNYTEINQFHQKHYHPNSYASGIFYIDAKKEVDQVKFYKRGDSQIQLEVIKFNDFNSTSGWFPVQSGDILLFPSTVMLGVDKKKGTNTRTSLSFNVFMKGKIGDKFKKTELVLK